MAGALFGGGGGRRSPGARRLDAWVWVVVAATVGGALLRLVSLGTQSFDGDELLTAWYASERFGEQLHLVATVDKNPYTYPALMWAWAQVFGLGEVSLRMISALAGIALIPVGALAAKTLAGPRVAALTAVLLATNPFLVWYSQQARPYALLALITGVGLLFLARAVPAPGRLDDRALRWWSVSGALAIAVNELGGAFVAAGTLWLLWTVRRTPTPRGVRRVLGTLVPSALVTALLVPLIVEQSSHGAPGDIAGIALGARLLQVPKAFLVGYNAPAEATLTVIGSVLALAALAGLLRGRGQERGRGGVLAGALALGSIGLVLLAALVGADFLSARYLLAAVLPGVVAVACGAVRAPWAAAAAGGLAVLGLVIVLAVALDGGLQRQDYRGVARALGPPTVQRVVITSPNAEEGAARIYLPGLSRVTVAPSGILEIDVVAVAVADKFSTGSVRPPRPRTPPAPLNFTFAGRIDAETYTLIRYRTTLPQRLALFQLLPLALSTEGGVGVWRQSPGLR